MKKATEPTRTGPRIRRICLFLPLEWRRHRRPSVRVAAGTHRRSDSACVTDEFTESADPRTWPRRSWPQVACARASCVHPLPGEAGRPGPAGSEHRLPLWTGSSTTRRSRHALPRPARSTSGGSPPVIRTSHPVSPSRIESRSPGTSRPIGRDAVDRGVDDHLAPSLDVRGAHVESGCDAGPRPCRRRKVAVQRHHARPGRGGRSGRERLRLGATSDDVQAQVGRVVGDAARPTARSTQVDPLVGHQPTEHHDPIGGPSPCGRAERRPASSRSRGCRWARATRAAPHLLCRRLRHGVRRHAVGRPEASATLRGTGPAMLMGGGK